MTIDPIGTFMTTSANKHTQAYTGMLAEIGLHLDVTSVSSTCISAGNPYHCYSAESEMRGSSASFFWFQVAPLPSDLTIFSKDNAQIH